MSASTDKVLGTLGLEHCVDILNLILYPPLQILGYQLLPNTVSLDFLCEREVKSTDKTWQPAGSKCIFDFQHFKHKFF